MARIGMGPEGRLPENHRAGPEKKAAVGPAMSGGPQQMLGSAVGELKKQHPYKHDDLGPHHEAMQHKGHAGSKRG